MLRWALFFLLVGCSQVERRFPDRLPLRKEREVPFLPAPSVRPDMPPLEADMRQGFFPDVDDDLALRGSGPARDVNSLDEVPDSPFFENRIGTVSADDVARGGIVGPPMATDGLLRVKSAANGQMVVEDKNGTTFLLKLDPVGMGGLLTGSHVVATRLLWALGYPVGDARLADFSPDQVVAAGASAGDVATVLSSAALKPDGHVRAVACRIPDGKPLGPMPWRGVRGDDPNDRVPHEDRRELRGLAVIYAWMNLSDVQPDHVVDFYTAPGLVRHSFRDLENALAAGGSGPGVAAWWSDTAMRRGWTDREGLQSMFYGAAGADYARFLRRMRGRNIAVGSLEPMVDPGGFSFLHSLAPFDRIDPADAAWAARLLLQLDDAHIAAAVKVGDHPPAEAARLVEILAARRQAAVRAIFARASPFGGPVPRGAEVCVPDLGVSHGLPAAQIYTVEGAAYRVDGPDVCLSPGEGYTVATLRRARPQGVPLAQAMKVHILKKGTALRVVGIER